jgi:hypothetical protein
MISLSNLGAMGKVKDQESLAPKTLPAFLLLM